MTDIGTVFMEISPFVLLQDTRLPEKTQKPGISALSMTFTKGQINTAAVQPIRGSFQKRFAIELSEQGTVPR